MVKNSGMHAAMRSLGTLFNEGALGTLTDGQLLDRIVERRDAPAFEAIVERYEPLVWGVCRRVLRDHHDAEDAFQATFLVLARKAASVMPQEKLGNWLYGVAFQTAMKARTTRAKRRARERPAWEMTEPEAVPHEHAEEWLARLDPEVARLPEKYRMPIILCGLEGKTHRQAAEQLGWPVGTVSGRLSRARALLASRLSRPGTPLTVGALGVLLAHDVARAGARPELVRSTAQSVSLPTAGKAAAGMVSAEVAALTGEVVKTMLINKLKLVTLMLLVVTVLGAGGIGLTYRAQATEPAQPKKDARKPDEPRKTAEAELVRVKAELQRLKDLQRTTEGRIQELERRRDVQRTAPGMVGPPDRPKDVAQDNDAVPDEGQPDTDGLQPALRWGGYIFTASPTGNRAIAYNPVTREEKSVELNATKEHPLRVTPVRINWMSPPRLVGLHLQGPWITRVAVFDLQAGKWLPLDLDEPVKGDAQPKWAFQDGTAYDLRPHFYTFSLSKGSWDHLNLKTIHDRAGDEGAADGSRR